MKKGLSLILIVAGIWISGTDQVKSQTLVESVAAVVGDEVIYLSDIENTILDLVHSGDKTPVDVLRCNVLQQMLISKLFLDQARIDSIVVTPDQVESELNVRMNDAIRRAGSQSALEGYFNKSFVEIQRDIRKALIEQMTQSEVQNKIAENIQVTPNEVKRFFSDIPRDSLPIVPEKVQISIIQLDPPGSEEDKAEARQKLLDLRSQILAGKPFNVLAIMYSEDPATASRGGERGYMMRGELEKPYADAAFSLTKNSVSRIVEADDGFHIIQLIDRKGEMVNTRHILIKPKVKPEQAAKAMAKLDSLANLIRKDSITFSEAAMRFSTHKDSRINGGRFVSSDPSDRNTWFTLEELNPDMYVKVRELKIGEISDPFKSVDENGNTVFRIVKLDNEIQAHRANLKEDYESLYNAALMNKRAKTYEDWVKKKIAVTYIKISDEFKGCDFLKNGWLK